MASIGEVDLTCDSNHIGRVRVLGLSPASAVFPRLALQIGWTLQEIPNANRGAAPALTALELRELSGELRLSEAGDAIGTVQWAGARRYVRSNASYVSEAQITCTVDLDPWRLEVIEARRDRSAPRFWLQLWPTITAAGAPINADARAIELRVPREVWTEFLATVGTRTFDILEIQYGPGDADEFCRAVARLRQARTYITQGMFEEAVAQCRMAFDALRHELPSTEDERSLPKTANPDLSPRPASANVPAQKSDPLRTLLNARVPGRKGEEYAAILAKLKQIGAMAHHDFGKPTMFSRVEAQFIVRMTEAVIAFIGALESGAAGVAPAARGATEQ